MRGFVAVCGCCEWLVGVVVVLVVVRLPLVVVFVVVRSSYAKGFVVGCLMFVFKCGVGYLTTICCL